MKLRHIFATLALFVSAAAQAAPCSTQTDGEAPTPLMYSAREGDAVRST